MERFQFGSARTTQTIVGLVVVPTQGHTIVGVPVRLSALGVVSDGTVIELTDAVTWASTCRRVATVDPEGVARAHFCGSTLLVATFATVVSDPVRLQVHLPELACLRMVPSMAILPRGTRSAMQVVGMLCDGCEVDVTSAVTWSSSDPSVVMVDRGGGVTAVSDGGFAYVRAGLNGVHAEAKVIVTASTIVALTVEPRVPPALPVGSYLQFTAVGLFSDGRMRDLTQHVGWDISDERVLAVCEAPGPHPGLALGRAPGVSTVTARVFDLASVPVAVEVPGSRPRVRGGAIRAVQLAHGAP